MSDDAKRSVPGAPSAKLNSDDRKPLPASVAAASGKRVVIKSADMFGDMQKEAIDIAIAAFEKYGVEKDVAENIKKEFDKRHGPTWHCIVGRNFDEQSTSEPYALCSCALVLLVTKVIIPLNWVNVPRLIAGIRARPLLESIDLISFCLLWVLPKHFSGGGTTSSRNARKSK
ncbi:hypothetical protein TIFTF001_031473 [Ficus carica]|uniref:Dynein light chain n=1 Tax=Ficus carica TaxID=3494 RepID=A0AA88DV25_FICCA|nr:hypothetical protein TIFTF001_031473 [Ficus carica]